MRSLPIGSCRTEIPFASSWYKKFSAELNFAQITARLLSLSASDDPTTEAMMANAMVIFILRFIVIDYKIDER